MSPSEAAVIGFHLLRTKRGLRFASRHQLEAWQAVRIARFLRVLASVPFYRGCAGRDLSALPVMNKARMLEHFTSLNGAGITLEHASRIADRAERSRDFSPTIGDYTVGLSSGTSGPRGVFLVSGRERARWAGVMLGRTLTAAHLRRMLAPGGVPLRVAFFLRANSNLYQTLTSSRIDFRFFDLHAGVDPHLPALDRLAPDVLVAPARVLTYLADRREKGAIHVQPSRVISVAEVLEPDDARRIEAAFGQPVHQLYQCTEGFLGFTCEHGVLHLNEEYVHIEPEWLDESRTRFRPIVTDFSRTTQPIVRYRLDDVLRVRSAPCRCGRHTMALEAIDGRCDDILWFQSAHGGQSRPVFPDILRHALTTAAVPGDYRIVQNGDRLRVSCSHPADGAYPAIRAALEGLADRHGLCLPALASEDWREIPWEHKRRRIVCEQHG